MTTKLPETSPAEETGLVSPSLATRLSGLRPYHLRRFLTTPGLVRRALVKGVRLVRLTDVLTLANRAALPIRKGPES